MKLNGMTLSGGFLMVQGSAPLPPGDPYWANVSLLMNNTTTNDQTNNVFLDSSTNNFTVTRVGSPAQGTFTPFTVAPNTSYSTSANGGSMLLNGSTDYLTVADSAALQMGSGNFTIEFWLNFSSLINFQTIFDKGYTNAGGIVIQTGSGTGGLIVYMGGSAAITEPSGGTVGSWVHYALVRNGSTLTLYRNGSSVGTATNSTNLNSTATLAVGSNVTGATPYYFNGLMSSFRMVKGTAVYTGNFTPSTTPLTAISGTSLLLNFTNAGIFDGSTKNMLITNSGAKVSTAQSPFGGASLVLNGSTDFVSAPDNPVLEMGSGNFTIECWVYWNGSNAPNGTNIVSKGNSSSFGPYGIGLRPGDAILQGLSSTTGTNWEIAINGNQGLSANTWTHVAYVRNGNTFTLYKNGVSIGTATNSSAVVDNGESLMIGRTNFVNTFFGGYISDVRITKGVARYTANFTPPTQYFLTY